MPEGAALTAGREAPARVAPARRARALGRGLFRSRAWDVYLLAATVLSVLVVPRGPGQTAVVDALNVVALFVFGAALLITGTRVELPYLVPMLVMTAGSLVAMVNAASVGTGFLTLLQDVYLYLWFVMLVAVIARRGDLRALRILWVATAVVVSGIGFWQMVKAGHHYPADLFTREGVRAAGTLYNANMCADYLMLSLFVWLSLKGRLRRAVWLPAGAAIVVGLLLTKSNGAMGSTLVGLLAAGLAWAFRARPWARARALAVALAAVAVVLLGWRLASEGALEGAGALGRMANESFLGRMQKSAPGRVHIWSVLARTYERTPLGIGPGNSQFQPLKIGEQEREGVFVSKEAHSDYLGYAIERGPAAFLALVFWFVEIVVGVALARRAIDARLGGAGRGQWVQAALIGALVASAMHSAVIEKLHFRHFWLFLALACALSRAPWPGTAREADVAERGAAS